MDNSSSDTAITGSRTTPERRLRERKLRVNFPKIKAPSLTPAERTARFRASVKQNPELWESFKAKEAARKRRERRNLTEEQKAQYREKSRERQRRYQQRLREKGIKPKQKVKVMVTRSEREKKRAYWKQKQAECRARKSSQKKRRIKEYDRSYRSLERSTDQSPNVKVSDSKESSSNFSPEAVRKAASRAKSKFPKNAEKFAESLSYIIAKASPAKKEALKRRGIDYSPKKRQEHECRMKVIENFRKQMKEKKSLKRQYLWAMKVMKKYKLSRTTSLLFDVAPSDISRSKDPDEERKKRSDALSHDVKRKINFFYNKPSVSTTLPDHKAVREEQAKKVLDRPLKDVFDHFQKENPDVKVGFSTFAANKPKNIKPHNIKPWYSCLCEVCTNVDLKLKALNNYATSLGMPKQFKDKYNAVNITLCEKGDETFHKLRCVDRQCTECRADLIMTHLQPLLEGHGHEVIEYTRWDPVRSQNKHGKMITKVMMVKHKKTLNDTAIELVSELEGLSKHLFNARWQQAQFSSLIKDIPENCVVLNLDFAENYTCVSQMEIQTAHLVERQRRQKL